MQYVNFGKADFSVSRLGFGGMRFPFVEVEGKLVLDEDKSIQLLRRAIELGINYFDTAPNYCDSQSELVMGKVLASFRNNVFISTKNQIINNSGDDYEKRLETSLCRLNTDYIDFYHFWGINLKTYEERIDIPDGPLTRAVRLKEQGVLKHISFSFHDDPQNMIEIIKRGNGIFSSVLCQYNLLDRSHEDAIAYAHSQGLGVVVMGPVGGGRLGAPSKAIQDLMPGKVRSTAETALRFVMSNPGIHVALSGMDTIEMLEENCRVADNAQPLSGEEEQRVEDMLKENERLAGLYCTGCNYCMPCPKGINIPEIFKIMNYHRVYELTDFAKSQYAAIGKYEWIQFENALSCSRCGLCEKKCPQRISIRSQLKQTHETLTI